MPLNYNNVIMPCSK